MRRLALILVLLCALPAMAATKLRLHDQPSSIAGYKTMDLALGGVGKDVSTAVTNTAASGTNIQVTKTAGGTALAWISEPLHAGFTLSGTVTGNPYGKESATGANASLRWRLYQYTGGAEGAAIAVCQATAELTTSITLKGCTATPTSTVFAAGDRIVAKLFLENCNATSGCPAGTMGGSQTVTVDYDGPTDAADGSTWIQLNETVTFDPNGTAGGTPTLFNYSAYSNSLGNAEAGTTNVFHLTLPNPSLSGNAILVFAQASNDSSVASVTDESGNVYQSLIAYLDVTNDQRLWAFVAPNAITGTRKIDFTLANGSTGATYFSAVVGELRNVALSSIYDGAAGNAPSSCAANACLTVTSGSVTPLYSGDLVCQYVVQSTNSAFTAGSQSNITWVKKSADRQDGQILQCGVYSSTSALNPTMTQGTNQHYAAIGVFLKSSAAGTAPAAGIRVNSIQHVSLFSTPNGPGYSDPTTVDFPAINGELLAIAVACGKVDGVCVTGITDNKSNTWTKCGAGLHANPHTVHYYHVPNATADGTLSLTVTQGAATSDSTLMMYAIDGAATSSACGATASTNANQTGNTQTLNGPSFTPQAANSVILSQIQQEFNTENSITSPSGAIFDSGTYSLEALDGPLNFDQNGGWAHFYNGANTSAEPWTWHFVSATDPQQEWISYTVEFKAPAAAGGRKRVFVTSE